MDIGVKRLFIVVLMIVVVILSTGCATMMKNFNRPQGNSSVESFNRFGGSGDVASGVNMFIKGGGFFL